MDPEAKFGPSLYSNHSGNTIGELSVKYQLTTHNIPSFNKAMSSGI